MHWETRIPFLAMLKVFSSFLIQSEIAIVALAVLLAHGVRTPRTKLIPSTHTNALVAALVDFHESQCYFPSTIQIIDLIVFYNTQKTTGNDPSSLFLVYIGYDVVDSTTLVILATSGSVPTTLTLACITRHGRHSYHFITLTTLTCILATMTLASSTYFFDRHSFLSVVEVPLDTGACETGQRLDEVLFP